MGAHQKSGLLGSAWPCECFLLFYAKKYNVQDGRDGMDGMNVSSQPKSKIYIATLFVCYFAIFHIRNIRIAISRSGSSIFFAAGTGTLMRRNVVQYVLHKKTRNIQRKYWTDTLGYLCKQMLACFPNSIFLQHCCSFVGRQFFFGEPLRHNSEEEWVTDHFSGTLGFLGS